MRIAAIALCATLSPTLLSAATPFSKDGEATVYLAGAYEKQFVLSFDAEMQPQQGNQSWSTLAITLLGGRPPSDSISIGLFPSDRRIRIFVSANRGATNAFRDTRLSCEHGCRLTLRGDVDAIVACVDGREISRWPRFEFEFPHPSVQLNGEVDALGDRLQAQLRPVVMQAAGAPIARPTCSFTTGGIHVRNSTHGALRFSGSHSAGAPSDYVSLADGRKGETCDAIR